MDPFLTTLYQNWFSAQRKTAAAEDAKNYPICSIGTSHEILEILKATPGLIKHPQDELLYKVDQEVAKIVREGNNVQSKMAALKVSHAKGHERACQILIVTYLESNYRKN